MEDDTNFLPDILYYGKCRSEFTQKKALVKLLKDQNITKSEHTNCDLRQSKRHKTSDTVRVYEKICIFCKEKSKYVKSSNTREQLIQAISMRADERICNIAATKSDERILSITSRDIVAAEAHYMTAVIKYM